MVLFFNMWHLFSSPGGLPRRLAPHRGLVPASAAMEGVRLAIGSLWMDGEGRGERLGFVAGRGHRQQAISLHVCDCPRYSRVLACPQSPDGASMGTARVDGIDGGPGSAGCANPLSAWCFAGPERVPANFPLSQAWSPKRAPNLLISRRSTTQPCPQPPLLTALPPEHAIDRNWHLAVCGQTLHCVGARARWRGFCPP